MAPLFIITERVTTGLTALIGRGGWWARRASEEHPYTIGNRERKAVSPLLVSVDEDLNHKWA
ncbi:MAG: hypothetical protein JO011_04630 [Ktedonobacteraceae bacterium]|nr:hypothetical protein [Ktedonobacteraceae bacterium]MBV9710189.1 hypothetical protein [Ktedonobacteraceae bacterium]